MSNRRNGFTLLEVLISLTITAALLLAMGGAFTAAGSAVEMNDRYFRSVQQARVAMNLMMNEIRRCQAVVLPAAPAVNTTATATSIELTTFDGKDMTYAFVAGSGNTTGVINATNNATSTTRILVGESNSNDAIPVKVISAQFSILGGNDSTGANKVAAISLTMTVQIGKNQLTLSGSAAPRVNAVSMYQ